MNVLILVHTHMDWCGACHIIKGRETSMNVEMEEVLV